MKVQERETELGGKYLGTDLADSSDADLATRQRRLDEDGYLLLRGFLDREEVLTTKRSLLKPLADGAVLDPEAPIEEAVLNPKPDRPSVKMDERVQGGEYFPIDWKNPQLRALTTSPHIKGLFTDLLGGPVVTYDFKWVRAVGPDGYAKIHWDAVFWEAGNVYTCWIPLGDIPVEMGTLAVLTGSEELRSKAREAPRDLATSFDYVEKLDPFELMDEYGGRLETTGFEAGDVLVFTMYTPHMSLANKTNRIRVSTDIRFQLESEPLDMQYMGEDPPFKEKLAKK